LLPSTRRKISHTIGSAFYGLLFCVATCLSLLCLFAYWRTSSTPVWDLSGIGRTVVEVAFIGSWISLLYSISLTGLGYQTGWTPWWHWFRNREQPRRGFTPRGAYLWIRHPVYLSFLGLIWFNPAVTMDRLLLAGIWSGYILVGSYLKDERLAFYVGQPYRDYQSRVIGYPLALFGPLARTRPVVNAECDEQIPEKPIGTSSKVAA
jgi:protein-S-isoprenylcysteine O-methyltransferase Ste14